MIYITGFPHSGTSFLSEVVFRLGLNFGNPGDLKGTNQMNRHGHFEYLPIRNLIWDNIEKQGTSETLHSCHPSTYRIEEPNPEIKENIEETIDAEGIEVYKDTFYPVIHKYLPPPALILTIYRSPHEVFLAPIRANMPGSASNSFKQLNRAMGLWYSMLDEQFDESIIKLVNYNTLSDPDSFRSAIESISGWVGVPMTGNLFEACEEAWDPSK